MSVHILIVEDEARIADFLVRGLKEEGYRVEHAPDGIHAWVRLQRDTWDLVILDWWLPGEDGLQLLQRFRAVNRRTPVLFLTARDAVSERVTGLDAGANDYLCKPFSFAELLARVRVLIRSQNSESGVVSEYGDISIDLRSQRVTRAGHLVDLTAKEFSLLLCFLQHPNTVLSRARLYETVWGDQHDGQSNTLEVHIKELRRKVEQFGSRVIQTRRGSGYILTSQPQGS
jgi:DNA-binding response OmpR family regulator